MLAAVLESAISALKTHPSFKERLRPWYLRNIFFPLFPNRQPAEFIASWKIPRIPAMRIAPAKEGCRDFLFLPMVAWHSRFQRPQLLARAIAKRGHRCFYLNPHLGRQFARRNEPSPQISHLEPGIYELHIRLPREPVFHHRALSDTESTALAEAIETLRQAIAAPNFIQIIGFPTWCDTAQKVRETSNSPLLYDCHDLVSGFANVARSIVEQETTLAQTADLTVASAATLDLHLAKLGVPSTKRLLLRNAVGFNRVAPKPVPNKIGYVGALEDWFDVEAVAHAAASHPEWQFHLAGRVDSARVRTLAKHANIHMPGEIAADEVPAFLATLSVGLIPFRLNPLTIAADPLKLYEYLAASLPVVSSKLPETARFSAYIHYYDSHLDFPQAIATALQTKSAPADLTNDTWDGRATELLTSLGCLCES